ncbi:hypothetical protein Tco_1249233, partial [Tanacetum coccineum]
GDSKGGGMIKEEFEKKGLGKQSAMNVESTPHIRALVDDTQELFGDDQSTDNKESEVKESGEQTTSSHEEEMGPSFRLTFFVCFLSIAQIIIEDCCLSRTVSI